MFDTMHGNECLCMEAAAKSVTLDLRPEIGRDRDLNQSQVKDLGQTHIEYHPEPVWGAAYVTVGSSTRTGPTGPDNDLLTTHLSPIAL